MNLRIAFVLLLLFVAATSTLSASHIMGGELTWQCQPDGRFVFAMKLYRDCNGIDGPFSTQILNSNSPAGNIPLFFSDTNDISPVCNPDPFEPHISCEGAIMGGTDTGAVQEFIFHSNPVMINGVPPQGGWTFSWSDCCRNSAIVNVTPAGYVVRTKMYAYNGRNTYPCFDSSPQFYEHPIPVFCSNFPTSFNQNTSDLDLDSLTYDWSPALVAITTPVSYASGYTYDNPLPDSGEDTRNHRALMNPLNGQINFTSYTSGTFVVCTKTSSWKCGVLVAEVFRDMQIILKTCRPLDPGAGSYNHVPDVQAPFVNSLGNPVYIDTVFATDTVSFQINMQDMDLPPSSILQELHLEPTGPWFSNDFVNASSCLLPPCATITPSPLTTSGPGILNFIFNWVTSCDHVLSDTACQVLGTVHNFVFKALDDFCPIPGLNLFTVSIVILPPPGSPAHPDVFLSHDTLFCSVTSDSYQWFLNDTVIPGANSNYYIPAIAGRYSVQAIPLSGCPAKSSSYAFTPVGIYFLDSEMEIHVSPNPFHHNVNISATGKKPVLFQVCLMDALGQTILSWNHSKGNPDMNEVVDLSFLPAGIYLVQFRTESAQKTFRLVKVD